MQSRNFYFDNIKGILVFLVVLAHLLANCISYSRILNAVYIFIYLFHIPLFVFMSGCLSKGSKSGDTALIKFLGLYLFVSFSSTFFSDLIYFIFSWPDELSFYLFFTKILVFAKNAVLAVFLAVGPSWYLLSLIFWRLITPSFNKKRWLLFSVVAALLIGGVNQIEKCPELIKDNRVFAFYLAGYLLDSKSLLQFAEKSNKLYLKIGAALICVGIAGLLYFKNIDYQILYGFSSYSTCGYTFLSGIANRSYVYFLGCIISLCLLILVPRKESIITSWGKNSINVYIWHIYLLPLVSILENILSIKAWFSMIAFTLSLGTCMLLSLEQFVKITSAIKDKMNRILFGK